MRPLDTEELDYLLDAPSRPPHERDVGAGLPGVITAIRVRRERGGVRGGRYDRAMGEVLGSCERQMLVPSAVCGDPGSVQLAGHPESRS